ncbi:hypothetical protein [Bradyrhizobium sp. Ash2021]|uniref:hypothetical protein n=1 Tax=Bradyrhizobium sp. Ash2021 TaxID=2954771 RepID=UPI002815ACE2|nr:hypothetical protein [Bradyrhizobium sp. Ash2021]WMT71411.1 hypothetical protein NL528_25300 [Bradyrhizobium sp. Ash2021]
MNRQPRPATPNTQRLFGRIKAKPCRIITVSSRRLSTEFQRPIGRLVGIIEDFPATRDQICLFIAQGRFGLIAVGDQTTCDGHDIGMASDIFQRWHLAAVFNFPAGRAERKRTSSNFAMGQSQSFPQRRKW